MCAQPAEIAQIKALRVADRKLFAAELEVSLKTVNNWKAIPAKHLEKATTALRKFNGNGACLSIGEGEETPETAPQEVNFQPEGVESGEVLEISTSYGPASNLEVETREMTWQKVCKSLSASEVGAKDGNYFLRGACTPTRKNDNLSLAYIGTLDCDKTVDIETGELFEYAPDVELMKPLLDKLGFTCHLYTSHSHDAGYPRYRIIFLPDRPYQQEECKALHEYFHHLIEQEGARLVYAGESDTWAQAWYYPRHAEGKPFEFHTVTGNALSVDDAVTWYRENRQPLNAGGMDADGSYQSSIHLATDNGPIAWYIKQCDVMALLGEHGYTIKSTAVKLGDDDTERVWHRLLSPHSTSGQAGTMLFQGAVDKRWLIFSHSTSDPMGDGVAHDVFDMFMYLEHDGDKKAASSAVLKIQYRPQVEAALDDADLDLTEEQVEVLVEACAVSKSKYDLKRDDYASALGKGKKGKLDALRKSVRGSESSGSSGGGIAGDGGEGEEKSIEQAVIEKLGSNYKAQFFHDSDKECYCRFKRKGHFELWSIGSSDFREFIQFIAYSDFEASLAVEKLNTIVLMLRSMARFDGEQRKIERRVAHRDGVHYIDLCNEEWQVVEVVPGSGWNIVSSERSPIMFIRSNTALPLPIPERGGDVASLWEYMNIGQPDRIMMLTWLLDAWRANTQYPVNFMKATAGTGKTETLVMSKRLVDNTRGGPGRAPNSNRDLIANARNNHGIVLDNMSEIKNALSDLLCTLATGTAHIERKYYTNSEEEVIELMRPVMLASVEFCITREDLVDRLVYIEQPELRKKDRKERSVLSAEREAALPCIVGALLDLFSDALATLDDVKVKTGVRMQDFAKLGLAVQRILGEEENFDLDLFERQQALRHHVLADSPFVGTLLTTLSEAYTAILNESKSGAGTEYCRTTYGLELSVQPYLDDDEALVFETYPQRLLEAMAGRARQADRGTSTSHWPQKGNGVIGALDRNKKAVNRIGLTWKREREDMHGTPYTFRYKPEKL